MGEGVGVEGNLHPPPLPLIHRNHEPRRSRARKTSADHQHVPTNPEYARRPSETNQKSPNKRTQKVIRCHAENGVKPYHTNATLGPTAPRPRQHQSAAAAPAHCALTAPQPPNHTTGDHCFTNTRDSKIELSHLLPSSANTTSFEIKEDPTFRRSKPPRSTAIRWSFVGNPLLDAQNPLEVQRSAGPSWKTHF
jgi:hypothetical protein